MAKVVAAVLTLQIHETINDPSNHFWISTLLSRIRNNIHCGNQISDAINIAHALFELQMKSRYFSNGKIVK